MSGYVASGRIVHVTPRIARAERTIAPPDQRSMASAAVVVDMDRLAAADGSWVVERWSAARERLAQLTFYLFDPESWR